MSSGAADHPLRSDAKRNRSKILTAASDLVRDRGVHVSYDDIARAAGVGVGTVYRRFPDRYDLLRAIYLEELDAIADVALRAAEERNPWTGIRDFLEGMLELQASNRGLRELFTGHRDGAQLARVARRRIDPIVTEMVKRAEAERRLRPGVGVGDLAVVPVLIHAVMGASKDVTPELWRRWLTIILDGLSVQRSRQALPGAPPTARQVERIIARRV